MSVRMSVRKTILVFILPLVLLTLSAKLLASSGNPKAQLAWEPKTEILEYYSCGAADACWVAEVKNKQTKKRVVQLRCDSEQLFSSLGHSPEVVVAENCQQFEDDHKFQEITNVLHRLLNRPLSHTPDTEQDKFMDIINQVDLIKKAYVICYFDYADARRCDTPEKLGIGTEKNWKNVPVFFDSSALGSISAKAPSDKTIIFTASASSGNFSVRTQKKTYVLTGSDIGDGKLKWTISGSCVKAKLCQK
jgi:hypothetical protein